MATSSIETLDEDLEHIDFADDFISSDDVENLQSSVMTSDSFHEEMFTETDTETEPEPDEDDHSKTSRRLVLSLIFPI